MVRWTRRVSPRINLLTWYPWLVSFPIGYTFVRLPFFFLTGVLNSPHLAVHKKWMVAGPTVSWIVLVEWLNMTIDNQAFLASCRLGTKFHNRETILHLISLSPF